MVVSVPLLLRGQFSLTFVQNLNSHNDQVVFWDVPHANRVAKAEYQYLVRSKLVYLEIKITELGSKQKNQTYTHLFLLGMNPSVWDDGQEKPCGLTLRIHPRLSGDIPEILS
jgi:hypothetical protein